MVIRSVAIYQNEVPSDDSIQAVLSGSNQLSVGNTVIEIDQGSIIVDGNCGMTCMYRASVQIMKKQLAYLDNHGVPDIHVWQF